MIESPQKPARFSVPLSEGIQKFLDPASRGAGRFASFGIPGPDIMGPLAGVVEIGCGDLLLVGLAYGFWSMAHEARTDFAMLLGAIFLRSVGAGRWWLDTEIPGRQRK